MTEPTISHPWDGTARHWRDRFIAFGARRIVQPQLALPIPWAMHRMGFAAAGRMRAMAPGVTRRATMLGPRPGVIYTPPAPIRRIVWIHGGGFVVGSPRTYAGMLSHLAAATGAEIVAPSYRLAPKHPFPAAPNDVEAALAAAQTHRPDLGPLILGGDSAGGCLALVALAGMLARGTPPGAMVLFSPAADLDPARPVPDARDLLFPLSLLRRIARDYAGTADPRDPRLSPVHADFTGAPPVLIQCVAGEYLEGDSDAIAARLARAGARVSVEKAPAMPHVWQFMAGSSPLADDALARVGHWLDAQP